MTKSIYIHLPFCSSICHYCDFCKQYYNSEIVNKYLDALNEEITSRYQKETIETIYIGGGTPSSLNIRELKKLFSIIKQFKLSDNIEFTIEVNPENINEEKLLLFKENSVNRISIGIETTNDKLLNFLGRKHTFNEVVDKVELMHKLGFNNINVDLIYAIPNETITDLKHDLENITNLNISHISTYSLMINPHTLLDIKKIKNIDEETDRKMYDYICNYLKNKGFNHYEISNFSNINYESKHNLVYWHNERYYGFGLGASGYINNTRYDNTKSMDNYLKGKRIINEEKLTSKDIISYELILGLRLVKGINKDTFYHKYNLNILDLYNIRELIEKKYLSDDGFNIMISYDKLYIENSILINFL